MRKTDISEILSTNMSINNDEGLRTNTFNFMEKCSVSNLTDNIKMMTVFVATDVIPSFVTRILSPSYKKLGKKVEFIPADKADMLLEKLKTDFPEEKLSSNDRNFYQYIYRTIIDSAFKTILKMLHKDDTIKHYDGEELTIDFYDKCRDREKRLRPLFALYQKYRSTTASFKDDNALPIEATLLLRRLMSDYDNPDGVLKSVLKPSAAKPRAKKPHREAQSGKSNRHRENVSVLITDIFDAVNFLAVTELVISVSISPIHGRQIYTSIAECIKSIFVKQAHNALIENIYDYDLYSNTRHKLIEATETYLDTVITELMLELKQINSEAYTEGNAE